MSLFFRAASCAAILVTTVATMGVGSESFAAMLTEEVAVVAPALPADPTAADAVDVAFVSQPQVQALPEPAASPVVPDDDVAQTYATLRDAVDGYRADDSLSDEERCLAVAVYYESKGESLTGQMAVAHVVLNRVESRRFPNSVCGVVTQRSQFSFVRGGRLPAARAGHQWETAKAVALAAVADAWDSPVGEALFFHATRVSPGWGKAKVATVGNHVFYR